MTTRGSPPDYPRNPTYGQGVFRRRIRLEGRPGRVVAALEDTNHGFCVTVDHDGTQVTAIAPEARRTPYSTCPEAGTRLQALVGQRIDSAARTLNLQAVPTANCTHWLDLTVLAIRHAAAGPVTRQWDMTVSDETDTRDAEIRLYRDGTELACWTARAFMLTAPAALAGRPFYLGFGRWASQYFEGDALEQAFLMQKAYFVAQARRYDLDAVAGEPAEASPSMIGACYTYSPEVMARGVRNADAIRDFSDDDSQLLRFS